MAEWRQAFHLEPPRGWLNDPNGLCWFGGRYHVYFQYCPLAADGSGPKCWGHYESPDLLHWTFTGVPLTPDHPRDADGVYSGSAAADGGTLRLYYTGNVKHPGDYDYVTAGREGNTLCVETADGRTVGPKRLLLTNGDYPADCSCHVRDPKVWRTAQGWRMVLGARSRSDAGRVLLYRSADGLRWQLEAVLEQKPAFGYMWECPDYFELDGQGFLSLSPQGLPHGTYTCQNVYQSGHFAVDGDLAEGRLHSFAEWDMGFDFYAPQTFRAPDGRRILIGWMGIPDADYANPTTALGWQHCLTVPRQVTLQDGRLCQTPVRELDALCGAPRPLPEGETAAVEAPFRLRARAAGSCRLTLAGGLELDYDAGGRVFTLRFADPAISGGRTVRRTRLDAPGPLELDVLVDTSSVECYINGGSTVFATRFYPASRRIAVQAQGMQASAAPMRPMQVDGLA